MGQYDDALADLNRAVELDSTKASAILNRGKLYGQTDRLDDALVEFNRAIEVDPNDDEAIACRGEVYRLMGRYDDALTEFDRALELDPDDSQIYLKSALALYLKGDGEKAAAILAAAVPGLEQTASTTSHNAAAASELMICEAARNNFAEARRAMTEFLDRNPNRWQMEGVRRDLSELVGIPGIDSLRIDALRARLKPTENAEAGAAK
jgi:tetratricopeptide (TPR) repeat protein